MFLASRTRLTERRLGPANSVKSPPDSPTRTLSSGSDPDAGLTLVRVGWSVVSVMLVAIAGGMATSGSMFPLVTLGAVLSVAVGLGALAQCWRGSQGPSVSLQLVLLAFLSFTVLAQLAQSVVGSPAYGTDSIAFGQYAAQLVLHGVNPYVSSMLPALAEFRVPSTFATHYLTGHIMTSMSYPAGSFLLYVPFLLIWHTQAAVVVDTGFWIATLALLWVVLPKDLRFVAGLFFGIALYSDYVIGGVTDVLYLPFLIVAVWRWDRFGDATERSLARWVGPVAMGLAMSVKQTPWFFVPFLVVGVALEAHARGNKWLTSGARYAGVAGGVFVLVDLPWIIANPGAWWSGSVAPLLDQFVPMGEGLINISLVQRLGGGMLEGYTIAGAAVLGLAFLAFSFRYEHVKQIWILLVVACFYFTPRSLGNYLITMLPVALVAATTVGPAPMRAVFRRWRGVSLGSSVLLWGAASAVVGAIGLSLFSPAPLGLQIDHVQTNGQMNAVVSTTVSVTNNTGQAQAAYFTANVNGYVTNFWHPLGARSNTLEVLLSPHQVRRITLEAPDVLSMPIISHPFQMVAYTTAPATVSSSPAFTVGENMVAITPSAIDAPVHVGKRVSFTLQLQNVFGAPVRRAGVRLALGQIVYTQQGLLPGESSIGGKPEGASPYSVLTNRDGQAVVSVVGVQAQAQPVYYQAWVNPPQGAPTGYSPVVTVQYVK